MNLENLNLVEMSSQEIVDVDGGLFWVPVILVVICVAYVASSIHDSNNGVYQQGQP